MTPPPERFVNTPSLPCLAHKTSFFFLFFFFWGLTVGPRRPFLIHTQLRLFFLGPSKMLALSDRTEP